jgi:predicted DNA-binding protein
VHSVRYPTDSTVAGRPLAGIARNIELYNLAYRLAWKHISELQKREYPNVAAFLHEAIRRQLKEGAVEPLFIAAEALKNIERLTGQIHSDEVPPTHAVSIGATDGPIRSRRFLSSIVARYRH